MTEFTRYDWTEGIAAYHGDALAVLPTLAAGGVDAVVTDPPYGLEFMGKEWDRLWDERPHGGGRPNREGVDGYTRKNGFGKLGPSYLAGSAAQQWHQQWAAAVLRVLKPGGYLLAFGGTRTFHRLACALEDAGFEMRDTLCWLYGSGFPKGRGCLKPAWEPVLLCRRPGPRVLLLGIDECRVGTSKDVPASPRKPGYNAIYDGIGGLPMDMDKLDGCNPNLGRYPANVVHDGSPEVLEAFAAFGGAGGGFGVRGDDSGGVIATQGINKYHRAGRKDLGAEVGYGDTGTGARFFYTAKASKEERGPGNNHPCVKPLALMEWLVKLACPLGGLCLDPFAGSFTTALACDPDRRFIGIEREAAYVEMGRRRFEAELAKTPLFA